jgi:hypothetical protein
MKELKRQTHNSRKEIMVANREDPEKNDNGSASADEIQVNSVGKSLAAMALADAIREGKEVEIPSLGIKITKNV